MKRLIKKILIKTGIYEIREKRHSKKCSLLLQNIGEEALHAYFDVANELGINFIPMFGTLLGIYRNHDFIKHDDDIDMILDIRYLSDDLLKALSNHGFVFNSIFVASDFKGCQLPMKYKGLTCDIYFSYMEGNKIAHIYLPLAIQNHDWAFSCSLNLFRCKDVKIPLSQELIPYEFRNMKLMIPQNTNEILASLYGKDFMIPKKNAHADPLVYQDPLYAKSFRKLPMEFFKESAFFEQILKSF